MAKSELPNVLVQLPIYNEQWVVQRLIKAAAALDYPNHKITIQLLDDSTDLTSSIAAKAIAALKGKGHQVQHIRRSNREGFKAGALSHGMELANSDLITIFDADFIPQPDFLLRTAPYFADPAIGLVQTRWAHVNADHNILTKLMAIAIDNHFAVEHAGKQNVGAFINFNGTAGVWRRNTIEQSGGWSPDSLTEDLDLSFRAQCAGWKFLYIDGIETAAELPSVLGDLRTQQYRWTKGAIEAGKKNLFNLWRSNALLAAKLIGTLQLTNGFLFPALLGFSLCAVSLHFTGSQDYGIAFVLACGALSISSLSIIFSFTASQWIRGKNTLPQLFAAARDALTFIILSTGFGLQNTWAVLDGLSGRKSEFVRTAKHAISEQDELIQRKPAATTKTLPKSLIFESAMALVFSGTAILELLQPTPLSPPLLITLTVFAVGYFFLVVMELSDRKFFVRREISDAQIERHERANMTDCRS